MAELLFWPAVVAYSEAAVALAGSLHGPGRLSRLGTWGVRLGWLLQTALLGVQAARADGFPWSSWAGSLNLFLVVHVGFVLAAFAGFTLAAALSALYLWQERRLKRRSADILRLRLPALATLESITRRTISFALPALTLGIAAGIVRLRQDGGGVDALMVVTLLTWAVYGLYLLSRPVGRRAAYLALAGFVLVIVARLGLPLTHFS